jgi:hypothetical protein
LIAGSEIPHTLVAAGANQIGMDRGLEGNPVMKELGKRPVFIDRYGGKNKLPVGTLRLA